MNACCVLLLGMLVLAAPPLAGRKGRTLGSEGRPITSLSNPAQPKYEVWFPKELPVMVSNSVFRVIQSTILHQKGSLEFTELIAPGSAFTISNDRYTKSTFRVISLSRQSVTLGMQGSMERRTVPVRIVEDMSLRVAPPHSVPFRPAVAAAAPVQPQEAKPGVILVPAVRVAPGTNAPAANPPTPDPNASLNAVMPVQGARPQTSASGDRDAT